MYQLLGSLVLDWTGNVLRDRMRTKTPVRLSPSRVPGQPVLTLRKRLDLEKDSEIDQYEISFTFYVRSDSSHQVLEIWFGYVPFIASFLETLFLI